MHKVDLKTLSFLVGRLLIQNRPLLWILVSQSFYGVSHMFGRSFSRTILQGTQLKFKENVSELICKNYNTPVCIIILQYIKIIE